VLKFKGADRPLVRLSPSVHLGSIAIQGSHASLSCALMTDYETMRLMLERAEIPHSFLAEESGQIEGVLLHGGLIINIGGWPRAEFEGSNDNVECYMGFYTQFVFDSQGTLRKVRMYE
jgi:hypothetical protein